MLACVLICLKEVGFNFLKSIASAVFYNQMNMPYSIFKTVWEKQLFQVSDNWIEKGVALVHLWGFFFHVRNRLWIRFVLYIVLEFLLYIFYEVLGSCIYTDLSMTVRISINGEVLQAEC